MKNIPEVKLGIIAVSRDCFPIGLSIARRENIVKAYDGDIYECKVTVENEKDMIAAVDDVRKAGVNALVVFLGNFGPETPETLIAKRFHGPCMFVAAAEGDGDLIDDWNGTWLTVEDRPVALYPISDEDQDGNGLYITTKFTPVLVNGERMNLVIEFNEETGEDTVLGAQDVTPTGVQGKGYRELEEGDIIQPVCDYFGYDGTFMSAYELGDPFIVPEDGQLTVVNKKATGGERMLFTARLTDYYQASYWLPMTEWTPESE